jgi:hypothetical protein
MMDMSSQQSYFGVPQDDRAEQMASLLRAGLDEEFVRQLQRATAGLDERQADALVALINLRLANGVRRRDLKLVVARRADCETTITVLDRSSLFGNGWSVARQTFAV